MKIHLRRNRRKKKKGEVSLGKDKVVVILLFLAVILAVILFGGQRTLPLLIPIVFAHCDTMDGPVITEAKAALKKGEVTPVLKWVKEEREAEVKEVFQEALAAKKKGKEAQEKAEMRFFEALVRIHRAGEDAEFTGLKPAGTELEPAIKAADAALTQGSAANLIQLVSEDVASGIRRRFEEVLEKKKHKDESVAAGREFVAAYVEFVHYVEHLDKIANKEISPPHHEHRYEHGEEHSH